VTHSTYIRDSVGNLSHESRKTVMEYISCRECNTLICDNQFNDRYTELVEFGTAVNK